MGNIAKREDGDIVTPERASETTAIMSVIERAAMNPDVDIDKMERLLQMQERIMNKQAEMAFTQAMTASQSEMRSVAADATNPQTRSKYASYDKLNKALRPVYTRNGFSLSFNTDKSERGEDFIKVLCIVSHKDGHSKTFSADMPADGKGAKGGDVMTKTHATGAAMSYGMRYLLKMIFNVAIGEDDTDGNDPVERINADQEANIIALMQEVKAKPELFCKYFKIKSVDQLAAHAYGDAIRMLEQKRKAR